ncbi:hypothetical protein E3T24_07840, partial [Cryobacterium sp. TmT2-59]
MEQLGRRVDALRVATAAAIADRSRPELDPDRPGTHAPLHRPGPGAGGRARTRCRRHRRRRRPPGGGARGRDPDSGPGLEDRDRAR